MRFGNLSGLSSVPSRLGLSTEANMLQAAQGVGSSMDAYLRTLAAMHHMVCENSQGKDVTPSEYRQVLKNALASECCGITSELVVPKAVESFYCVRVSDLTLSLTYDQGVFVIATVVQGSKRFWIGLRRTSEDNGVQVYEPTAIAYHPCHPEEKTGYLAYPVSGPSANEIIGSTNSGTTIAFQTDMGLCGITVYIKDQHFTVLSFNCQTGKYAERNYFFTTFPDGDFQFFGIDPDSYFLPSTYVGKVDVGHGGSTQTGWAKCYDNDWRGGAAQDFWEYFTSRKLLTQYPSLDKALITVLASDARILLAAD